MPVYHMLKSICLLNKIENNIIIYKLLLSTQNTSKNIELIFFKYILKKIYFNFYKSTILLKNGITIRKLYNIYDIKICYVKQ